MHVSSYAVESNGCAFDFNPSLTAKLAGDVFSVNCAKVIETFNSAEYLLNAREEEQEWRHFLKHMALADLLEVSLGHGLYSISL